MLISYKIKVSRQNPIKKIPLSKEDVKKYLIDIYGDGYLWILPAGYRSKKEFTEYSNRIKTFDWQDFYKKWNGESYFEVFRRHLNRLADAVLIDSRTGVTEMGGVCTYQLADAILMFCSANSQNIDGTRRMLRSFSSPELLELRGRPLKSVVIPSRIERLAENKILNEFRREFIENFGYTLANQENDSANLQKYSDLMINIEIPYVPAYSFKEEIAVRQENDSRSVELEKAYSSLLDVIWRLAPKNSNIDKQLRDMTPRKLNEKIKGTYFPQKGSIPSFIPLQKPIRMPNFVGRENEMEQLLKDLQPGKVITICGPGGMGKTALATEAIWRLAPDNEPPERFPDGIIFYSFYHKPQATSALEHIARTYDEDPHANPLESARKALKRRQALIILDGTEEADDLKEVLSIAGNCGILITSRRHRDAPADFYDLPPLPLSQAVQLLQSWAAGMATDDSTCQRICNHLGCLPLGIFLAGRYMAHTHQNDGEYLAWLEMSPLAVLNLGDRQHQSIQKLMEQSLDHVRLQAQECLAIAGALSLKPFKSDIIAYALDISILETNINLGDLVDYGLLIRPQTSYQLAHAIVHTYARSKLPLESKILSRIANYYLTLIHKQRDLGLPGYALLDSHLDHILAVQSACNSAGLWNEVSSLALALDEYLDLQGHWIERIKSANLGLLAARSVMDLSNEISFLTFLGLAHNALGEYGKAIAFHKQALDNARRIGDKQCEGKVLGNLGKSYAALDDSHKAIKFYKMAKEIASNIKDRQIEGIWMANLGGTYSKLGKTWEAIKLLDQALAISREIGDKKRESANLCSLGRSYAQLGETWKAIEYCEQALVIARKIGDRRRESANLGALGRAYAEMDEIWKAIEYYSRALAIAREIGDRRGESANLGALGRAYAELGDTQRAIEYNEQALAIAREIGDRRGESANLGALGRAYAEMGDIRKAIEYDRKALAIARRIKDRRGESTNLGALGRAYAELGDIQKAIEYNEQALAIAREIGDRRGESTNLGSLGRAYTELGDIQKAIEYNEQALAIAREIGDRRGESTNLGSLGRAYTELGDIQIAIEYNEQALAIARETRARKGESANLGALGQAYAELGDIQKAIERFEKALTLARETGAKKDEFSNLAFLKKNARH